MRISIRWKLLASYLLLLLVTGGTLYVYLTRTLEQNMVEGVEETLRREAELAAFSAVRDFAEERQDASTIAREIGRRIQARVTIMTEDGAVVGDSEVLADSLPTLENHRTRPEIASALSAGSGTAMRYSTTLKTQMLYVATRFSGQDGRPAVLRLALPLSSVDEAKAQLHVTLGMALGLATFLSVALSLALSGLAARTLRELSVGAARIGGGHFKRRLKIRSRDELGDLTEVMNDMAERLDAQMEKLSTERNRLDAILRGMGEGLLVTDAGGAVILINPAFRVLFDASDEIIGRPLHDISRHPALHATFRAVVSTCSEQTNEIAMPSPGPTLLTHWVPLLTDQKVGGVVAVFHDISELKRLERIRRDFVANVSHELRTPVTVIKGYAETLTRGTIVNDPENAVRFAEIIDSHAGRLAQLIADLLTLSELEANNSTLDLLPVALDETIAHCQQLLVPKAAGKNVHFVSDIAPAQMVMADRRRLEQVVVNLLDNAVKYSPQGSTVTVRAADEGDMVRVLVSDTGPGVPLLDQSRVFERFYRVDTGRSRAEGGTGLGLAIVKHIVQLHGGSVGVDSPPGSGATFSFTLRKG